VDFVGMCRELDLFSKSLVAIDDSKFKAVNSRDKNFTRQSVKRRRQRLAAHINRYRKLDAMDLEEPEIREITSEELKRKIASMEKRMAVTRDMKNRLLNREKPKNLPSALAFLAIASRTHIRVEHLLRCRCLRFLVIVSHQNR
jgi:hypothetical protein